MAHAPIIGSGLVGALAAGLAQDIMPEGSTGNLIGQGIIVTTGAALFLFFDRRERNASSARNEERRQADAKKDARIAELEQRIEHLTERLLKRKPDAQ